MAPVSARATERPPDAGGESDLYRQLLRELAPFDHKLHPPARRGMSIDRERLPVAILKDTDLVSVTAGAGYGKTTLLAQWLRTGLRSAWLTVGPEDNDPGTLVAYLIRAFDQTWSFPQKYLAEMSEPGSTDVSILLPRLARLVSEIPQGEGLVIDEIDVISDQRCHRILEGIVHSLPPGSQLLMSGRSVAPIGLARLRTQMRILELDESDLALSYGESAALVRTAGLTVDPDRLRRIHQIAEGWPAGLHLLAASVQSGAPLPEGGVPIADYIEEQVLSGLDRPTLDFLTQTSILTQLDGTTCDALLDRNDSAQVLARLAESHVFVVPIDLRAGSYRYHGLLADVLQKELQQNAPMTARQLHARASTVFLERNDRASAVRHAILAGDSHGAATLVWQFLPAMLGLGKGATVVSWLELLSDEDYDDSPVFAVARMFAAIVAGDGRMARTWSDAARHHNSMTPMPDGSPLDFYLKICEALICDNGICSMVETIESGLALDVASSPFLTLAVYLEGAGLALLGEPERARPFLDQAVDTGMHYPAAAVLALAQQTFLAIQDDSWLEARRLVERGQSIYERFHLQHLPNQALFSATAAVVAVHDGHEERSLAFAMTARAQLARIVDFLPWLCLQTVLSLALVEFELGREPVAVQLVEEARRLLLRVPDSCPMASLQKGLEERLEEYPALVRGSLASLTTAEIRLLGYLPTHLTFGQIAQELCVSINTVKSQAKAIYRKLDVESRRSAVTRASDLGLVRQ